MKESAQRMGEFLIPATSTALPLVTLMVACLMVSRIRYPHVVNQLFHGRHTYRHFVKLIFALVIVFAIHELAIPVVLFCFVIGFAAASPVEPRRSGSLVGKTSRYQRFAGKPCLSHRLSTVGGSPAADREAPSGTANRDRVQ